MREVNQSRLGDSNGNRLDDDDDDQFLRKDQFLKGGLEAVSRRVKTSEEAISSCDELLEVCATVPASIKVLRRFRQLYGCMTHIEHFLSWLDDNNQ